MNTLPEDNINKMPMLIEMSGLPFACVKLNSITTQLMIQSTVTPGQWLLCHSIKIITQTLKMVKYVLTWPEDQQGQIVIKRSLLLHNPLPTRSARNNMIRVKLLEKQFHTTRHPKIYQSQRCSSQLK